MKNDHQLLSGLSIAHYVLGAITLVPSTGVLLLIGVGAFMILMAGGAESLSRQTSQGWVLVFGGAAFLLIVTAVSVMTIIAGSKIKRRQSWMYCVVVSCLQIINFPFGSILGILTLIFLNKASIKATFISRENPSPPDSHPASISPPAPSPENTKAISVSQIEAPRSPFVTILSWIGIAVFGISTLVLSVQRLMMEALVPREPYSGSSGVEADSVPAFALMLLDNPHRVVFGLLIFSLIALVASIGLLYRENLARLAFIGIMALGALWNAGVVMTSLLAGPLTLSISWILSQVVSTALLCLYLWIIAKLLSHPIRAEFKPTTATTQP